MVGVLYCLWSKIYLFLVIGFTAMNCLKKYIRWFNQFIKIMTNSIQYFWVFVQKNYEIIHRMGFIKLYIPIYSSLPGIFNHTVIPITSISLLFSTIPLGFSGLNENLCFVVVEYGGSPHTVLLQCQTKVISVYYWIQKSLLHAWL